MGFLDKAKGMLTKAVDDHGDKISDGLDKAADVADQKTGGKHQGTIDGASDQARNALDKLDGKDDNDLGKP